MNLAMFTMFIMITVLSGYVFALSVPLLDWFKLFIVHITVCFDDWVLIWDNLCCLCSIEAFECFCSDHVSWQCSMMHGMVWIHFRGVPFSWRVFPWCFPECSLEVCRSALMLPVTFAASQFHSAGKAVRFECVFVCVWVFQSVMMHLFYSGTYVTVFDPFRLCCLFFLDEVL